MKQLPDACIDLTITSPPYDNVRTFNGYTFDFHATASQLFRITKPGGVVVWVVGDATINGGESGESFRQALVFIELGFRLHDTMIYRTRGFAYGETNRYLPCFQYMFVLSKGKPKAANLLRDRPNKNPGKWSGSTFREPDGSLKHKGVLETKPFGIRYNVWEYAVGWNKPHATRFGLNTRPCSRFNWRRITSRLGAILATWCSTRCAAAVRP